MYSCVLSNINIYQLNQKFRCYTRVPKRDFFTSAPCLAYNITTKLFEGLPLIISNNLAAMKGLTTLKLAESNTKMMFDHLTKVKKSQIKSVVISNEVELLARYLLMLRISATGNYICASGDMLDIQNEYIKIENSLLREENIDSKYKDLLIHAFVRKNWIKIINTTYEEFYNTDIRGKVKEDLSQQFIRYCVKCADHWKEPDHKILENYNNDFLSYVKVDLFFNFTDNYSFTGDFTYMKNVRAVILALRYYLFIEKEPNNINENLSELTVFLINLYLFKTSKCKTQLTVNDDSVEEHLFLFLEKHKVLSEKTLSELKFLESFENLVEHMRPNGPLKAKSHNEIKKVLLEMYNKTYNELYSSIVVMFETMLFSQYRSDDYANSIVKRYMNEVSKESFSPEPINNQNLKDILSNSTGDNLLANITSNLNKETLPIISLVVNEAKDDKI